MNWRREGWWVKNLQMPWKIKTVPLFRQSPRSRENDQWWNWSMNHGRPNMIQDISWFSSSAAFRCYWNSSKRQSCFAARSNWRTEWNMKRPQWLMVIQSVWAEERRGMPLSTDLFPEPPKLQFKWPNRPIPEPSLWLVAGCRTSLWGCSATPVSWLHDMLVIKDVRQLCCLTLLYCDNCERCMTLMIFDLLVLVARLRLIQLSETARVTPVIQNAEFRRGWKSCFLTWSLSPFCGPIILDTKTKICGCLQGLCWLPVAGFQIWRSNAACASKRRIEPRCEGFTWFTFKLLFRVKVCQSHSHTWGQNKRDRSRACQVAVWSQGVKWVNFKKRQNWEFQQVACLHARL